MRFLRLFPVALTAGIALASSCAGTWTEPVPTLIASWPVPGGRTFGAVGICTDASGFVYVANGPQIYKFTSSGSLVSTLDVRLPPIQAGGASDVAVDDLGRVYFLEEFADRLHVLNPDWSPVTSWGSHGTGPGDWWRAHVLATDGSSYVHVLDWGNNRLFTYMLDGTFVSVTSTSEEPQGLAVSPGGCIVRSGYRTQSVVGCNRIGPAPGSGAGELLWPTGVAVDSDGRIYVSETSKPPDYPFASGSNHRIQVFAADGTYLTAWGSQGSALGHFMDPWDLAVSPSGHICVFDQGNERIQIFGNEPTAVRNVTWGALKALMKR